MNIPYTLAIWTWRRLFCIILILSSCFIQYSLLAPTSSRENEEIVETVEMKNFSQFRRVDNNEPCAVDVLFVLDGSSSVKADFSAMRDTVINISSLLNVGPNTHRVALLEFSGPSRVWPRYRFGFAQTTSEFVETIKRIPYIQGTTLVGKALTVAKDMLDERRTDVQTVVLVITDGFSQDQVDEAASAINEMPNVIMFALEIPESYFMDALVQIAGNTSRVIVRPNILEKAKELLAPWLDCTLPVVKLIRNIPTSTTTTTTTTTTMTTTPFSSGCELDLVLIVDSSSSVINHFNKYIELSVQLIQALNIGEYYTRVALIQYASKWRVQIPIHFHSFYNKQQLIEATRNIIYTGGTTNTAAGLSQAITELQDINVGARPGLAKQAIVVFTDGFSQHDPRKASDELRNLGVIIYVIAEELEKEGPNFQELWTIAGDKQHVFIQSQIPKLVAQLTALSNLNCRHSPSDTKGRKEILETTKLPFRN